MSFGCSGFEILVKKDYRITFQVVDKTSELGRISY